MKSNTRRDFLKKTMFSGLAIGTAGILCSVQSVEKNKNVQKNIVRLRQGFKYIPVADSPESEYFRFFPHLKRHRDQFGTDSKQCFIPVSQIIYPPNTPTRYAAPRKIDIPDVGGFKVLKGDFHIHTILSDGKVMPEERVREAADNGFDVIAITDHIEQQAFVGGMAKHKLAERNNDFNNPYDWAKPEADGRNLLLVRGAEITKYVMPPGHFNVLFAQDINPIAAAASDWRKMLQIASEQGAFVHWNHPGWVAEGSGGLYESQPMYFPPEIEEVRQKGWLHGIEVFANSYDYYSVAHDWCNEKDLTVFANSDIHHSEAEAYCLRNPRRPMNLILAKERTVESVKEAFFAKRVVGCAANMIFGRQPWVENLFRSCVEIKKTEAGLTLRNLSDIPCDIEADGKTSELLPKGSVIIDQTKKLTVSNWFIGTFKPLEISL